MSERYKYDYNAKEWLDELGLNWYDYGMRMYEPSIGRWNAIDPLVEKYFPLSAYSFAANSPLILTDNEGMDIVGAGGVLVDIDESGQIYFTKAATRKRNKGAVRIIKAMMKTPTGRNIIKRLIESKTKTRFVLSNRAYYKVNKNEKGDVEVKVAYGMTSYGHKGKIELDDHGNPYFKSATITIYAGTFKALNGDAREIPKFYRDKIVKTNEQDVYKNFGEFLNGVGVHEGTHVLEDIFSVMDYLGIEKIQFKGKDAQKLFDAILKNFKNTDIEKKPNENEKKSRMEFNQNQ